jgi:hypothetical protein
MENAAPFLDRTQRKMERTIKGEILSTASPYRTAAALKREAEAEINRGMDIDALSLDEVLDAADVLDRQA